MRKSATTKTCPVIQLFGKQRVEFIYYIYNPITKQFNYKLICLGRVMIKKDNKSHCHVFIRNGFLESLGEHFNSAIPIRCAVHWYSEDKTSVYFDVDTECFSTMPVPNLVQLQHDVKYFGESRGHLHLIVTKFFSPLQLQFDVLEMAADYSGWFVRYHVNLDAMRIAFPDIRSYFAVLDVIRAQKEEESIVVVLVDNKAISFNVHDRSSKKLCDQNLLPPARGSASSTASLIFHD